MFRFWRNKKAHEFVLKNSWITILILFFQTPKKYLLTNTNINIIKDNEFDGGLAQSVERRNHNPCVVGSNPSPATTSNPREI